MKGGERQVSHPRNVFVWDLDDTLIWTSKAYSAAFIAFFEYLSKLYGGRLMEIRTLGSISEEIDKSLVTEVNPDTGRPYGFTMARFPESLVRTYRFLCDEEGAKYDPLTEIYIRAIGLKAFSPLAYKEDGLVAGAAEALGCILAHGDGLKLVTKGERLVQSSKIQALDLGRWFGSDITIVDSKGADHFRQVIDRFPGSRVISVGNSYISDILPALEAGADAVYIPYYTWRGEPRTRELDPRVIQLRDVRGIIGLYQLEQI
jgi:putative hydrolase of the HAD superfamily